AAPLAAVFTNHRHQDADAVATYIQVLAVFLPLSSAYTVAIAATRGFGTMVPNALLDRIAKSGAQTLAVACAVLAGGGSFAVAVAWSLPIGIAFAITLLWLGRLVHRVERRERATKPPTDMRRLYREFWIFTAPRGLTGIFQVTTLWVGTLMVGSLMDTASASIYTASSRYLVAGSVVNLAIIQAIGPKLSELLTAGARERAQDVYQVATAWLMMMAWPMYIGLAVFAPLLLRVFKPQYVSGTSTLEILAITMLVATGIGPVDMVLLMGGRSFWNLFNVMVALTVNIALGLLLIPEIGIAGAAIAWAGSLLVNNVAPLAEVRAFLKVHPFGRGFPVAAGASLLCYGVLGMALRLTMGTTIPALLICIVVGTAGYAWLLWRFRDRLAAPLRRPVEPAAFGVPAVEGAAAGGVGGAGVAGVVGEARWFGGWGAGGVVGFEAASEFGPGVASGPGSWWWGAELVEMSIERTMAGLGHAPVCLPHPHQRPREVAAAAFGLECV